MNTFFGIAFLGLMLILVGRSMFKLINEAQGFGAKDRRRVLLIVIAVMLGFVATVIIVHYSRVG